jgi:hypothetical protein
MARTPIPKTTGQGISRRAYKQAWELKNAGRGPKLKMEKPPEPLLKAPRETGSKREYPKGEAVATVDRKPDLTMGGSLAKRYLK